MKKTDQRLKNLIKTNICQAENVDKYREELILLAQEIADVKKAKIQSKFFKALSDEKRIRILKLLTVREMWGCELMIALDVTQPNLSHYLRILENQKIVSRRKKGKWVYCSLADKKLVDNLAKLNLL